MPDTEKRCLACGSTHLVTGIAPTAATLDGEVPLTLTFYGDPDALIFRDTQRRPLHALVCTDCGHVAFSVDDPQELWEIVRRAEDG